MSLPQNSRKAQKFIKDDTAAREKQRKEDLKWVMSDPRGRRYMFHLLDQRCGVFSRSYTGNSDTYMREGKRAVGIEQMEELQKELASQYVEMVSEAFKIKQHDDLVAQAAEEIARGDDEP